LGTKTTIQFKKAPEIISGIELSTNDYKMAWSFSEYLSALQKKSSEGIKEKVTPQPEKKEHANT
jgi:F-type H+-transporting ATPase subunit b